MAVIPQIVCDKCGANGDDVIPVEIRMDIRTFTRDLCAKDRQPLEELAALGEVKDGGLAKGVERVRFAVVR